MIFLIVYQITGLTTILVVVLVSIFDYINNGTVEHLNAALIVMAYFVGSLLITSLCFKKVVFWIQ